MSDEIIWDVIGHNFCAFKIRTDKNQNFCRNQYNVTGLCNRQSCPLANQQYATVRSVDGKLYLYMRTAERSHMPSKWWERIKLSKQYSRALQQIDERLIYWPNFLIHKCKQRLTRLTQVNILARRQALKDEERHYVGVKPKVKRREETRERKALKAAKLEKNIEKELLDRLKSGAYGENPLNVDEKLWKRVMNKTEKLSRQQQEENEDEEYEDELESELEDEESDVGQVEYVEDDDAEDDYRDMQDIENAIMLGESDYSSDDPEESESEQEESENDDAPLNGSAKRSRPHGINDKKKSSGPRKAPRVEVEYEQEEPSQAAEFVSTSAQDW